MNSSNVLNGPIIAAMAALITAIIGGLIALITNQLSRRNEHKLAILKTLLDAAYKEYEFRTRQEIDAAKDGKYQPNIKSFTEYVIFYKEFAKVYSKKSMTKQDIIDTLSNNKELIDAYYTNREIYRPEYHNQSGA